MDGPNKFAGGEVENSVARAMIAVPDEQAPKCIMGEFVHEAVFQAEVSRASKILT
jgi:hypothetical protein